MPSPPACRYVTRYETKGHAKVESRILGNENVRFGRGGTGILDQGSRSLPHQNLREALDQLFRTYSQALDAVNVLVHQQPVPLPDGAMAVPVPPQDIPLPAQQRAAERQA